jgi:hypothetical protein
VIAVDDLLSFIRVRLDEEEQAARAAAADSPGPWRNETESDESGYHQGKILSAKGYTVVHVEDQTPRPGTAAHIARWDPARVLAEVEAKRRILDLHAPFTQPYGSKHVQCGHCADLCHSRSGLGCDDPVDAPWPCPTVRLLALPYADDPDYQQEWRPSPRS